MADLRAYIVDDEPAARQRIVELLERQPGIEVVGLFERGSDAADAIVRAPSDLVFLDVQMPELDGFGVIERVGAEHMPFTIFVTAYDRYALRAFEVHGLDYLLKPFSDERFDAALQRARYQLRIRRREELSAKLVKLVESYRAAAATEPSTDPAGSERRYLDRIALKSAGRVRFLGVTEIDWIEAAGVYVRLHAGGARHLLRETLGALEAKLDPERFTRIHRSTMVPLDRISELRVDRQGEYEVILKDGTHLKLSQSYRERLQEKLGQQF